MHLLERKSWYFDMNFTEFCSRRCNRRTICQQWFKLYLMMTSLNGNIFRVTSPLCGNSPVPVNSPHIGQWRGALMFSLIYARINDWVNNSKAGDLRRYRGHYDVIVMPWLRTGEEPLPEPMTTQFTEAYMHHPLSMFQYSHDMSNFKAVTLCSYCLRSIKHH